MRHSITHILLTLLCIVGIPSLAAWLITLLWNPILPSLCGFASIGFWQALGLFFIGQLLTVFGIFGVIFVGATMHHLKFHSNHRLHDHWHRMTDEQKKEFMAERRARFGFRPPFEQQKSDNSDAQ